MSDYTCVANWDGARCLAPHSHKGPHIAILSSGRTVTFGMDVPLCRSVYKGKAGNVPCYKLGAHESVHEGALNSEEYVWQNTGNWVDPCGAQAPLLAPAGVSLMDSHCTLDAGHTGLHRNRVSGMSWGVRPEECGDIYDVADGSPPRKCSLTKGHESWHGDGMSKWPPFCFKVCRGVVYNGVHPQCRKRSNHLDSHLDDYFWGGRVLWYGSQPIEISGRVGGK